MDQATAKKKFDLLFSEINGFDISMQSRKMHRMSSKELTYGEVLFDSFWDILEATQPQKNEVFYDLGCGTGKPVFIAALSDTFAKATGIEILPEVLETAQLLAKSFGEDNPDIQTDIDFICADIFSFDFSRGDVIYLPSTCFDNEAMDFFSQKSKRLKQGARMITLTKQLSGDHLKLVHRKLHEMTWGDTTVHIYTKR